jgi:hypothetical protein
VTKLERVIGYLSEHKRRGEVLTVALQVLEQRRHGLQFPSRTHVQVGNDTLGFDRFPGLVEFLTTAIDAEIQEQIKKIKDWESRDPYAEALAFPVAEEPAVKNTPFVPQDPPQVVPAPDTKVWVKFNGRWRETTVKFVRDGVQFETHDGDSLWATGENVAWRRTPPTFTPPPGPRQ